MNDITKTVLTLTEYANNFAIRSGMEKIRYQEYADKIRGNGEEDKENGEKFRRYWKRANLHASQSSDLLDLRAAVDCYILIRRELPERIFKKLEEEVRGFVVATTGENLKELEKAGDDLDPFDGFSANILYFRALGTMEEYYDFMTATILYRAYVMMRAAGEEWKLDRKSYFNEITGVKGFEGKSKGLVVSGNYSTSVDNYAFTLTISTVKYGTDKYRVSRFSVDFNAE